MVHSAHYIKANRTRVKCAVVRTPFPGLVNNMQWCILGT